MTIERELRKYGEPSASKYGDPNVHDNFAHLLHLYNSQPNPPKFANLQRQIEQLKTKLTQIEQEKNNLTQQNQSLKTEKDNLTKELEQNKQVIREKLDESFIVIAPKS